MSAFDDEFGLFGEESDDLEPRSTLGARKIATGETIIDDIEPENARAPRRERSPRPASSTERAPRPSTRKSATSSDPWATQRRATELLGFLAKKLVAKPDDVSVELFQDEAGQSVIELVVDGEDLGKVIGRGGRVAHALRTIIRASAEARVSVDILDKEEATQAAGDDDVE